MSRKRNDGNYEVGRGRPPERTRFRKGKSGNPNGRPTKKSQNVKSELIKELAGTITIHENGNKKSVPKQRAMIKGLVARAIQGDGKALSNLLSILTKPLGDDVEISTLRVLNGNQRRVLDSYRERLKAEFREEFLEERRRERDD